MSESSTPNDMGLRAISTTQLSGVLFDLDGTLIDTAPDFAVVVNRLLSAHNQPPLAYEPIRATVSKGARALVTLAFGIKEGEENFESLRQELLSLYSQHLAVKTCLFPGMDTLLNRLEQQHIPWGIVTNKPRLYAEPILKALALDTRCSALVCPDDVTHTKPDPEPLHLACEKASINPNQCIYVGDHRRDIEAGNNAKMTTIAAAYGYIEEYDPAESWEADYLVQSVAELDALLATEG